MAVFEKLREMLVEQLGVEEDEVTMQSRLKDDLRADEVDMPVLMMHLAQEFDYEGDPDEWEKLVTVGDVVNYIKKKTG